MGNSAGLGEEYPEQLKSKLLAFAVNEVGRCGAVSVTKIASKDGVLIEERVKSDEFF